MPEVRLRSGLAAQETVVQHRTMGWISDMTGLAVGQKQAINTLPQPVLYEDGEIRDLVC